jgi:hypothetical protein
MSWGLDPGFLGDDTADLTLDFNPNGSRASALGRQ